MPAGKSKFVKTDASRPKAWPPQFENALSLHAVTNYAGYLRLAALALPRLSPGPAENGRFESGTG